MKRGSVGFKTRSSVCLVFCATRIGIAARERLEIVGEAVDRDKSASIIDEEEWQMRQVRKSRFAAGEGVVCLEVDEGERRKGKGGRTGLRPAEGSSDGATACCATDGGADGRARPRWAPHPAYIITARLDVGPAVNTCLCR